MKEIEKMLKGKWYDANFDQELLVMRQKAELNCFDFNMSKPGSDGQLFALRKLLRNKLPKGLTVLAPVYFDYGKYTYFSEDVFIIMGVTSWMEEVSQLVKILLSDHFVAFTHQIIL